MTKQTQVGPRRICWGIFTPLLLLLFGLATTQAASSPIVVTDHGTYLVGEAIKVGFTNGPANAKDWIGIYSETTLPGDGTVALKVFTDGTATGAAGKAQGEVTFVAGLAAAGTYVAYLLENDTFRILAEQKFYVRAATDPQVRTDKRIYRKTDPITVTFSRGPGNAKDWIAIYAEGEDPSTGSTAYRYVDNTTVGTVGKTDGTVTIPALPVPGRWVAHLLLDDGYTSLASEPFTVEVGGFGLVTIQSDHDHYPTQQPIRIAFDGGPGNPADWIGVYRLGDRPGPIGSTRWAYVGGTQEVGAGLGSGEVTLGNSLAPRTWVSYFLVDDGHEIPAKEIRFDVVDDFAPLLQTSKRSYNPGEAIVVNFTNAPANAKDWVAIYRKGETPGVFDATLWNYTDGTRAGTAGITERSMTFANELPQGDYIARLFENDSYTILSSENFSVRATGALAARLVSISPDEGENNASASPDLRAVLENRDTTVNQNSIIVKLDNQVIPHQVAVEGSRLIVTTRVNPILPQGSQHTYQITFTDSAGATVDRSVSFHIGEIRYVTLPAPIYLETFESVPEGSIPTGWTVANFSDNQDIPADLQHMGSLAYANFTTVLAARLGSNVVTYNNTTATAAPYAQILGPGDASYVTNGVLVRKFADGKIFLGISGYHGGNHQILEAVTPDINLTGKTDIYLSFHSLMAQYYDAIEGIEMSTDGGTTWSPVVYYLEPEDIIKVGGVIDVDQTYNTVRGDIARFEDGSGGSYGSFVKAPLDAEVASHTQPRVGNDASDGTRIELIRLPLADNKATVRFRLFMAGTDSWYLGVDNFGVYSIPALPKLEITRSGSTVTISWPEAAGFVLQSSATMALNSWGNVPGVTGTSYSPPATDSARFYRLIKP